MFPYYGFGYALDPSYLLLVVVSLVLGLATQSYINSTYRTWSKVPSDGASGADVARRMLDANGCSRVGIKGVAGHLTDHYDPSSKVLRLSDSVYGQSSIAAVGVAAHETGHAIQHAVGYGPLVLRGTLVPIAQIGSGAGPALAIAGLIFGIPLLINIGILLFAGAVLFYLVTLPVEFNASKRAVAILAKTNTLSPTEIDGVKKVLTAAAMTYLASALTAIANLVRLILISRRNRN